MKTYKRRLQAQINEKFRKLRSRKNRLTEFEKLRKNIRQNLVQNWHTILLEDEENE